MDVTLLFFLSSFSELDHVCRDKPEINAAEIF